MSILSRTAKLTRSVLGQAALLRRNPEAFLRNVRQFTHPGQFLSDLLDLPAISPIPVVAAPGAPACVHMLLPSMEPGQMTGGPNTLLQVGCAIARDGIDVQFVAADATGRTHEDTFWRHVTQLTERPKPPNANVADSPLRLGEADLVLASFWTTAYQAAALLPLMRSKRFLYLIQDYEPGFYAWSSRHAMALESYGLPFHAIVNEAFLADYLADTGAGLFAEPGYRATCTVFEPAVDRAVFLPPGQARSARPGPRRLLLYARPTNPRNMLGMAVAALRQAIEAGAFAGEWEFLMIGARGSVPGMTLVPGRRLVEAPWADYRGYARLLQQSDILLCPMLSPHTSYPVLEMAACGGITVTNSFATKTEAGLRALSGNIVSGPPSVAGFTAGLIEASRWVAEGSAPGVGLALPATWDESLAAIPAAVRAMMKD